MIAFTRTMSDSKCTEGRSQSPPQHLSSMGVAMFDSTICRDLHLYDSYSFIDIYASCTLNLTYCVQLWLVRSQFKNDLR